MNEVKKVGSRFFVYVAGELVTVAKSAREGAAKLETEIRRQAEISAYKQAA
jgi:hypothetical protein